MEVSGNDRDTLIKTVMAEASRDDPAEQSAVAHVILNRVGNKQYGMSVPEVVFQPGAFESWNTLKLRDPNNKNKPTQYKPNSPGWDQTASVVDKALSGKDTDPTGGADRFQQPDIVQGRIQRKEISASAAAPANAQRIGNQVFWNSKGPAKPQAKDYADLLEDPTPQQSAQTAGEAVPSSQKPNPEHYADLLEEPDQQQAKQSPPAENSSGLFGELPNQVRAHPYIAGGLAALAVPAVAAVGAEAGIGGLIGMGGTALMGLLRNRAVQTGAGIALGEQIPNAWHYLARVSGIEPTAP